MTRPYLLGHGRTEHQRLDAQHQVWRDELLPVFGDLTGLRVLELGCGNGALLRDLADMVGPTGRLVGLELSPDAAKVARGRMTGLPWVEVRVGDAMTAVLDGPYDVIVARWVFSYLADPQTLVHRAAAALGNGGRLVVQDYHHDGMSLFPRDPAIDRVIEAVRATYAAKGCDLWIAGRLPQLYAAAGLELDAIRPHVRVGGPDDPAFQWVERFLFEHLPTFVVEGQLRRDEAEAFAEAWREALATPGATLFTPMVVDVVGRR